MMSALAPDDSKLREFIADFAAASSLMRSLRRTLASVAQLSATEYTVMIGLWHCQRFGQITVRQLANHLHLAPAHVMGEIGQLTKAGLIVKKASLTDGRALDIRLSSEGQKLLNQRALIFGDVNVALFAGVQYQEMVVVHRFLKRIIEQAPEAISLAHANAKRTTSMTALGAARMRLKSASA